MRLVVQRVQEAKVLVDGDVVGGIEQGALMYLGVATDDEEGDYRYLAEKAANLRIFDDETGRMNISLVQAGYSALVVSQFTLYGDCRRGRRPDYTQAAPSEKAVVLYEEFIRSLKDLDVEVEKGEFGANMQVVSVNDGPVTLLLDSRRNF
ncbi:MAG: D-aminoacyl-tRNA deacylase [Limnochordia bacterium]|nr:D-aminoacyl-tRNA deacylase [Limnochordia bacterium]MDD2629014.1 D-aminoacyl-tRNA deacylase [Limnochordia bacterium]MDD4517071.1 D-aminoacyl-tRNA deacylase [Limnochordia bacterium]